MRLILWDVSKSEVCHKQFLLFIVDNNMFFEYYLSKDQMIYKNLRSRNAHTKKCETE